jgi:protein TonB
MEDRIGDLLAQRARLGGNPAAGLAVSVLLHVSIAAGIVYAAMHAAAPQETSTLQIQFAQTPATVAAPAPTMAAPTPKKLAIPEPVAEPPKPVVNAQSKTVPLSAFGQSTKKGSENPPAPKPAAAPPIATKPAGGEIPIGSTGVTGIEGDFPYTIYIDRMKNLIGQHWLRPQGVSSITTTVSFIIDRDGTIRDAKNEIPSGDGTFDRAALRAVLEASPLPPLPFAYNGTYVGVRLTFR